MEQGMQEGKELVPVTPPPKLTKKQQIFVQQYLIDFNATRSAIEAGYSKRSATFIGSENLRKPYIQQAIAEAIQERQKDTGITQERILKELSILAFADMKDYVEIDKSGEIRVKTWEEMPEGASRAVQEVKEVRRLLGSSEGDGKAIILEARLGYKHHSKVQALELLGKHLGMFPDKLKLGSNGDEVKIKFEVVK